MFSAKIALSSILLSTTLALSASIHPTHVKFLANELKQLLMDTKRTNMKGIVMLKKKMSIDYPVHIPWLIVGEGCTIKSSCTINRLSSEKKVRIEEPCIISSATSGSTITTSVPYVQFKGSVIERIICPHIGTPIIELHDTTVLGNIEFKSNPGYVLISGNTTIKGQIICGTLIELDAKK